MDKKQLMEMLKNMTANMTEEEIREVIDRLEGKRYAITNRVNREKSDWLRLLATTDRLDAKLAYQGPGGKQGILYVAGPSLLTEDDFRRCYHTYITPVKSAWWLFNGLYVDVVNWKDQIPHKFYEAVPICRLPALADNLGVRPVLIIEKITGELTPGEVFSISNGETFRLLDEHLALRALPIPGTFAFAGFRNPGWPSVNYWDSDARDVVNDWYKDLIRDGTA